jgi:glycosyltransferase involved in cell wall biosynthesis
VHPTASIVIPTRSRPAYLEVALSSVIPQAARAEAEVIVVNDGDDPSTAAVARRHDVRVVAVERPSGVSAGRNAGLRAARGDLIVLIDDDIKAQPGWLDAFLSGAQTYLSYEVFGGPIRPVLEGGGPRACGRESAPITSLDLGPHDRDTDIVWGANMALRRPAFETVGPFDETLLGCGDEEDWLGRYMAGGGRVRYLAAAGVEHRRTPVDATVRALARAAYRRGRAARRYDTHRGEAPPKAAELRTLAGCGWHIVRRRCANGVVLAAHSAGRLREALSSVSSSD